VDFLEDASTGTNIARRPWDQREELRAEYDDVHGTDRALWPVQHPGVVLDAVLSSAHGACLGCQCSPNPATRCRTRGGGKPPPQ
jgi:hypothetical protein